jgi:D-glycero-D-manno-heptose 1,7-bisphosphate phosphatase
MSKRIAFLDRDGVINELVERAGQMVSPRTFTDFEIIPGVPSAIAKLQEIGFEVVVVTNQPDISRGHMNWDELEKMNDVVRSLGVKQVEVCPHSDEDLCECRKPKSGLLKEFIRIQTDSISEIWMIGDKPSDIEAGLQVFAQTILITGSDVDLYSSSLPSYRCTDLVDAVEIICTFSKKT